MKKALTLLLALVLLLSPGAALAADSSVCFIAINDNLLQLSSQAYSQSGQYYVPVSVFSEFRIYNDYHSAISTARLYSATKQMFFNVATGETYDSENNFYTSSAIMLGSTVYVPVDFVCRQFGLSWSYIRGSGYGDVCRITNGAASLTDSQFLAAARPLMASRYNEYTGSALNPVQGSGTGVSSGDNVVFLSFQGLPSAELLNTLSIYGVRAAFFLTSTDIAANPETVRRIVGEGHNIGVLCYDAPGSMYEAAADALWSRARVATVMLASASREYDAICRQYAAESGLAYCGMTLDGVRGGSGLTVAALEDLLASSRANIMYLRIQCCSNTDANIGGIRSALRADGSVILAACETSEP